MLVNEHEPLLHRDFARLIERLLPVDEAVGLVDPAERPKDSTESRRTLLLGLQPGFR